MNKPMPLWCISIVVLLLSCSPAETRRQAAAGNLPESAAGVTGDSGEGTELVFPDTVRRVLSRSLIPGDLSRRVMAAAADGPHFILDLLACLNGDPYLRRLVDKGHALPDGYEPPDLMELGGEGYYRISRRGLMLRKTR